MSRVLFCASCGESASGPFCTGCGAPTSSQGPATSPETSSATSRQPPRPHEGSTASPESPSQEKSQPAFRWLPVLAIALVAVGALALALFALSELRSTREDVQQANARLREGVTKEIASTSEDLSNDIEGLSERLGDNLSGVWTELESLREDVKRSIDVPSIVESAQPSIFTIEVSDGETTGGGTGFVVSNEGSTSILLTNHHVLGEDSPARLRLRTQIEVCQRQRCYQAEYRDSERALDAAWLAAPQVSAPLPISSDTPEQGSPVVVIGSPLGLEGTVTDGLVSRVDPNFIQMSAPISPGNSGSPVLNAEGEVVGIATIKIAGGGVEGIGFAYRLSAICDAAPNICSS